MPVACGRTGFDVGGIVSWVDVCDGNKEARAYEFDVFLERDDDLVPED